MKLSEKVLMQYLTMLCMSRGIVGLRLLLLAFVIVIEQMISQDEMTVKARSTCSDDPFSALLQAS